MDWWWKQQLADEGIEVLIHDQHRIVSRAQVRAAGWSDADIRRRLRGRRWQTVHPGVYATPTGPIGYDEQLLAALLYAGPEAAWSHYTAAEQFGLIKRDDRRPVYVSIPWRRRVRTRPNGWLDVTSRPCAAAVQVLQVMRRRDPHLAATACSPSCPVR